MTDIYALVGSRICHDLISPIGAIGNGVELLGMTGDTSGPEMALIAESVGNANAKIRFFRVAFGSAVSGQAIGRSEIVSILQDVMSTNRLAVRWTPQGDVPRQEVKLAFLLIQCLETALPFGGDVTVERENGRWTLLGHSDDPGKLRINAGLWEVLSNPGAGRALSPSEVHFALVPPEVKRVGRKLTVETHDGEIRIQV